MDSVANEQTEIDDLTGLPIGPKVTWAEARWPEAKVLSGKSVRLEKLQPAVHGDALWETTGGLQNAALWQYMSEGPFAIRQDFDDAMSIAAAQTDPVFYAIVDEQTNCAVGRCALLNIRPKHGVVEVGHLLFSPVLQRTRGATEALFLMAKYAFDDLGYRRYEWKCNALNAKSRHSAERTGFLYEGVFRQHMIIKGRNRDSAWFSILDTEWPHVRSGFESWLAEENFDEHRNQRQRLSDFIAANRR